MLYTGEACYGAFSEIWGGDADALYKCLMELHAQRHLTDEEFFPNYVKAHIDRGAVLLDQEQRYGGDFLVHLTELEKGL